MTKIYKTNQKFIQNMFYIEEITLLVKNPLFQNINPRNQFCLIAVIVTVIIIIIINFVPSLYYWKIHVTKIYKTSQKVFLTCFISRKPHPFLKAARKVDILKYQPS